MDGKKNKNWFKILPVFCVLLMSANGYARGGGGGGKGVGDRHGNFNAGAKAPVPVQMQAPVVNRGFNNAPMQFNRSSMGNISRSTPEFRAAVRSPQTVINQSTASRMNFDNRVRTNVSVEKNIKAAPQFRATARSPQFVINKKSGPRGNFNTDLRIRTGKEIINRPSGRTISQPNTNFVERNHNQILTNNWQSRIIGNDNRFSGSKFAAPSPVRALAFPLNIQQNRQIRTNWNWMGADSRLHQNTFIKSGRNISDVRWRNGSTNWNIARDRFDRNHFDRSRFDREQFFGRNGFNNRFIFHDRHNFSHFRAVSPNFFFVTSFNFSNSCAFRPVFPYYFHRYVFVNPCGYWPYDYNYARYYRYNCYPYYWYGYNPIPYQYGNDAYNYYTYNYYGDNTGPLSGDNLNNLSNYQAQPPLAETSTDEYFNAGVTAFENNDYNTAIAQFSIASGQAPDDKVLAFAYSQAYFAAGDYNAAAQTLCAALAKVNPVTEGIFYPRGLYVSDEILTIQIDKLNETAAQNPNDSDLQLLLGYNYIGLGQYDKSVEPLEKASADSMNGASANALLQLTDKLQAEKTQNVPPSYGQTQ